MSSPISSLKKGKKSPLSYGAKGGTVPFRSPVIDESQLLDDVTSSMSSNRNGRNSTIGLPKLGDPSANSPHVTGTSNFMILSSKSLISQTFMTFMVDILVIPNTDWRSTFFLGSSAQ